jgi:hypothetical protein
MGTDRPDDTDMPASGHPDHATEHPDASGDRSGRTGGAQVETRDREEYDADLRVAVSVEQRAEPRDWADDGPRDQACATDTWVEAAERSRGMWAEHQRTWPLEERPAVARSGDPPGSWRGDSNRFLDSPANGRVEERCDRIAETERTTVSPAMREAESRDPRPTPDRLRAPPEGPRPHQGQGR